MAKQKFTAVNAAGKTVSITVEVTGTTPREIAAAVRRLGRLPASVVSTPARYAAGRVQAMAKKLAPKDTGTLKESLKVSKRERTSAKGKAVYDVRPMSESEWEAREDKRAAKGKARRGYTLAGVTASGGRYYYPASQEHGFDTVDGGHVEGRHYLRGAAEALDSSMEQIILDRAGKRLDQIWERETSES